MKLFIVVVASSVFASIIAWLGGYFGLDRQVVVFGANLAFFLGITVSVSSLRMSLSRESVIFTVLGFTLSAISLGLIGLFVSEETITLATILIGPLSFLGYYPPGADVWFPYGASIWLVSVSALILIAVLAGASLRRIVARQTK